VHGASVHASDEAADKDTRHDGEDPQRHADYYSLTQGSVLQRESGRFVAVCKTVLCTA
jgi:hypothetical protein